jgi:ATP-binding cassette subfamily B protein
VTAGTRSRISVGNWHRHARVARYAVWAVWAASPAAVAGLAVASFVGGLLGPATAWLQRNLLDLLAAPAAAKGGHQGHDENSLLKLAIALGLIAVVAAVLPPAQQYIQATMRRSVAIKMADRAYRAVSSWPGIARFESPLFADKLQLASQLSQSAPSSMITTTMGFFQAMISAVSYIITLLAISPLFTLAIALTQILAVAANLSKAKRQANLQVENTPRVRRQQSYGGLLSDSVAAKEVRLFGLADFLRGRALGELIAMRAAELALGRRILFMDFAFGALSAGMTAGGLLWIVTKVFAGELPIGDVSMFVMAAVGMQTGLSQVAASMGGITQSVMLFSAYSDVVSAPPDLPVPEHPAHVPDLRDGITIDDVWFRYDESHAWVLQGVNMFIPAGQQVALVGLNGSGKSTLVKLLCRLYDPDQGIIRWDGTDIRDFDPIALRKRITGVFQDYLSYELTVSENIGMGDLSALDDASAIRRAAEKSGADSDIAKLPDRYDTLLSRVFFAATQKGKAKAGILLSGGQRQRLALAKQSMS